jgi:hypothetical protein
LALAAADARAGALPSFEYEAGPPSVTPTKVVEGGVVTVHCPWSVKGIDWQKSSGSVHFPDGAGTGRVAVENAAGIVIHKTFHTLVQPGFYVESAPPKGVMTTEVKVYGVGPALIVCSFQRDAGVAELAKVPIVIGSGLSAKPQKGELATESPFGATVPPPKLDILGVTWKIGPGCDTAKLLTATVKIRNTGKPLPPGRAKVKVTQAGGSPTMASLDVFAPAIGTGETVSVVAPLGSKSPPPQLHELAGKKLEFAATVTPANPGAFQPAAPHASHAAIPKDFCASQLGQPRAPARAAPSPGSSREATPQKSPAGR